MGGGSPLPPSRLIGLHRHSLTNVLIIGGTAGLRAEVARAFHRESPLSAGPFVSVDCTCDENLLRAALRRWTAGDVESAPDALQAAEQGTLYLDPVDHLSPETQGLLLGLARRLQGEPLGVPQGPCAGRLVAGNPRGLGEVVAEGRFLPALHDALDKVRVELAPAAGEAAG
jgi:DNA-binding NtrC family response regulator